MVDTPSNDAPPNDAATAVSADEPDLGWMVLMTKNGATTIVHPSCVASHQRAGWVLA